MKYLSFLLSLILFAGCQSKQTVVLAPSRTAGRSFGAGKDLSVGSAPVDAFANLRQSETVKVYGMNRYVDTADSRLMHERHAVYRLEQQPAWTTRSPGNRNEVILGPIVGLRKPEYAPEPAPGETSREIFQARRGIQEANEGMKDLRESQEKLTSSVETIAKNTAEAERKLTAVLTVLNQRIKRLEGDNSPTADEQPQARTPRPAEEDVVVHGP
jgi:hypothetical protein